MSIADPVRLVDSAANGDRRALARAISIVEDRRHGSGEIVASAYARSNGAHVVGITGSPGAGKSTLTSQLIGRYRASGRRVGVVAVDPASPFTGGALLGDRVRMQGHDGDRGVFVRSMSNRGHLGGLADASAKVVAILDAAEFDPILLETVGVGQSEVEIVETAATSIVVVTPGWGDAIQAAKAGILEIGDLFVVNKADLGGADGAVRDLKQMLKLARQGSWLPRVIACSSASGEGVDQVVDAIAVHRRHLAASNDDEQKRVWIERAIRRALTARCLAEVRARSIPQEVVDRVASRTTDPWTAAAELEQS